MNILDLDEAQGLTADMVRQWLKTQAPRIKRTTNVMTVTGMGDLWTWPSGDTVRDAKMDAWLSDRVRDIAALEGRTLPNLLREINPRMREGIPSDDAILAHSGRWLVEWMSPRREGSTGPSWLDHVSPALSVCRLETDQAGMACIRFEATWPATPSKWHGAIVLATRTRCRAECGKGLQFWPCDAHGNKIRWPERDGVML